MDIATRFSLTRMKRCGAIMGRKVRLGVLAVYACLVCVCSYPLTVCATARLQFFPQESDDLAASQIMYPAMQCADVFFLKVSPSHTRPLLSPNHNHPPR